MFSYHFFQQGGGLKPHEAGAGWTLLLGVTIGDYVKMTQQDFANRVSRNRDKSLSCSAKRPMMDAHQNGRKA